MCDCIEQFDTAIREKMGDPEAKLETTIRVPDGMVFPNIAFFYHKKKKDGSLAARESASTIIPQFCPFCGMSYE